MSLQDATPSNDREKEDSTTTAAGEDLKTTVLGAAGAVVSSKEPPVTVPGPKENGEYGKKGYWDQRFAHEKSYDWLTGFAPIQKLLATVIKKTDSILIVGCGNSTLSADMYKAG